MSKELDQLVSYVEENTKDFFFYGDLKELDTSIERLFQSPQFQDVQTQKDFFLLSMKCYSLFSIALQGNLKSIPELLRYSLLSKCFHSDGCVVTPKYIANEVVALIGESGQDWYENQAIGIRIFNLRYTVLEDPRLDLEILIDQFENSGDPTDIRSILSNPNCPKEFLQLIIASDHYIFEDGENNELIQEAKSILSNRA